MWSSYNSGGLFPAKKIQMINLKDKIIPLAYFLSFRILNKFKAEKIVPEVLKDINYAFWNV